MLTPEEQSIIIRSKELGKTKEQAMEAVSRYRTGKGIELGRGSETIRDIKETGAGIKESIVESGRGIAEFLTEEKRTPEEKFAGVGSRLVAGIGRVVGETGLGIGKMFLSEKNERKVSDFFSSVAEKAGETEAVQTMIQKYNELDSESKEGVDNILRVTEGVSLGGTGFAAPKLLRKGTEKAFGSLRNVGEEVINKTFKRTGSLKETINQKNLKQIEKALEPEMMNKFVKERTDAYYKSFVQDNKSVLTKLENQAIALSRDGKRVTEENLLEDLVRWSVVPPEKKGKFINFRNIMDNIDTRQAELAQAIDPFLKNIPERTGINRIKNETTQIMAKFGSGADYNKYISEIDKIFQSYEKLYGKDLTANQLNRIRIDMNARTKAFSKQGDFVGQDVSDAVGDAVRARIDEIAGSDIVRQANGKIGQLYNIKKTAQILNNQPINIGVLGSQIGRLAGAHALGASGIAVGSGSLVLAGIAAHFGGDFVADMLRKRRFPKDMEAEIMEAFQQDKILLKQLIDETEGANKAALERLLLPAPKKPGEAGSVIDAPAARQGTSGVNREQAEAFANQIKASMDRNEMQKTLQAQARRFKSKETFINSVKNNPNWLKKFEGSGTTPESIADIVFP